MNLVEKELELLFIEAIKKNYDNFENNLEIQNSKSENFGDFQTNFAMINSKKFGQNPRMIAQNIINSFPENNIVDKLEIAGPGFINIFLKNEYLENFTRELENLNYYFDFLDKKGVVLIDYSSPNIAKRMHIGHLRSTIIGDSIKRMYNFLGYSTIADNHIGDWGTQFGKLIVAYRRWLNEENYKNNPIEELERIYVEFSNQSENNSELEDLARLELKKLHDGDNENIRLWKEFIDVSINEYNKVYNRLGINFDTYYGESFYHNMMPDVLNILKEKKLAVESEGAQVVFFDEKENLHPCIVQKKDGAFLYSTSDLACIKYRIENYNLNKLIYVTDERQQDHFKQFFKISEMLDWKVEKEHIWFGIMRFADGIFSTRKGNVIKLEDLLDEAKIRAFKIVEEKNPSLSLEEKENIAEIVGKGAVKYADLSQNRTSPIIFEWDKILSFEGNTAPYLQYTYARMKSILRKALENNIENNNKVKIIEEQERNLISYLLRFPMSVIKASQSYKPNILADYLYELSKKINTFYNSIHVLNSENEILKSRIQILKSSSEVLKKGLSLLGIETVERM